MASLEAWRAEGFGPPPPDSEGPIRPSDEAGLDEIENRGRFLGHPIVGHGNGVCERGLVVDHLDALHEVADQGLALRDRAFAQEVPKVRDVSADVLGGGQVDPAL
ncbi:MAG: hypothetical protein OXG33_05230, partial [Chloroflexi bacterium]|nr:hypothetical protein [Chloroflexota bacterium]